MRYLKFALSAFSIAMMIFLVLAPSLAAQTDDEDSPAIIKVDPASKARIKVDEDFWDFGSIPKGSVVTHDFIFRNTGTDTLVITKVKPTCGCTTAPLSSDRIAPGESTNLSVSLNTKKLQGLVRKYININCDDPINPYFKISFNANINNPLLTLMAEPAIVDFGAIDEGGKSTVKVKITNTGTETADLKILSQPSDKIVKTSLSKASLKPGKSAELVLEYLGHIQPGSFVASVTIAADGNPDSRFSIPISGKTVEK